MDVIQKFTFVAAALAWASAGVPAHAADFPVKPVRVIVPFAPGGSTDIVSRLVAQVASDRVGQRFIVENRAGASTAIGSEAAARSDPDGYTLLLGSTTLILSALLGQKTGVDVQKDLAALINVGTAPFVWTVNVEFPAKTLAEFIAYAKAHPGSVNYASPSIGGSQNMAGELLNIRAGIKMTHVLYKSEGLAVTDLVGNHVQITPSSFSALSGHLASGRLRPLAVTSRTRIKALPNVPTVEESGIPGYSLDYWNGFFAPAKTPQDIVDRLSAALVDAVKTPQVSGKLEELGFRVEAGNAQEFTRYIEGDIRRWRELIKTTGVVIEK